MKSKGIKDFLFLAILIVLAVWLSPLILIGILIYLLYRIRKSYLRKKLLEEIKRKWFLQGKYVFFLYSDSKKWKEYFETELIPKIENKAVIRNWSTRLQDGWTNDMEGRILKLYKPLGYFYPIAIVFLPNDEIKTFQFYTPYVSMVKSGKDEYKKLEAEFLDLVKTL